MSLLLAYYGDDFTGSTDALEFLTRSGVKTVLFTAPPTADQIERFPNVSAIGVAGLTRSLAPVEMERELRPAFAALKALRPRHVHYKVCSTFDSSPTVGSIGRALEIGMEAFGSRFVPLVVGAPPLGRYCVFGHLFARFGIGSSGAIYRLDRHPAMNRHPVTPADESDLRRHLAKQTSLSCDSFDVLTLARPESERKAALEHLVSGGARIVLFDVLGLDDLERIGPLLDPLAIAAPLFSVGSSAIEMALGRHWRRTGAVGATDVWPVPANCAALLVVSGSCSPVTRAQIAWAIKQGFSDVGIDPAGLHSRGDEVARRIVSELRGGRHVVLHTNPAAAQAHRGPAASASAVGGALGRIARAVIADTGISRLLVAGGDTSSYLARALGIEAVEMIAPLAPGAPLCRAHAPKSPAHQIEVNFKGGQVGREDYFGSVVRGTIA